MSLSGSQGRGGEEGRRAWPPAICPSAWGPREPGPCGSPSVNSDPRGAGSLGAGLWKPVLRGALDPWLHLPGIADLNQPCGARQGAGALSAGPHYTPRVPPTLLRAGVGVHVLHSRSRSALSSSPGGTREQTAIPQDPRGPQEIREQTAVPQEPRGPQEIREQTAAFSTPRRPESRRPPPVPQARPPSHCTHGVFRWGLRAFKFLH